METVGTAAYEAASAEPAPREVAVDDPGLGGPGLGGPGLGGQSGPSDSGVVEALRRGDEQAFAAVVRANTPSMLRVAQTHVPTRAAAEDAVQETWLVVLGGLDRFELRSSLRTWIFGILVNVARRRGARERRSVPFSAAFTDVERASGPTVDPSRFQPPDSPTAGGWSSPPSAWDLPEPALLSQETRTRLRAAIADLPPRQRAVLDLRDVQGMDADVVCDLLDLSPGNQRVLLHRARAQLRTVLGDYLDGEST